MEGEDSVRTVDCLRGRLLAERAASKNAKDEEQKLQNKLMELEKLLRQEAKSRNKAEKKLKFLMKKLQSINVSDESSENSGLIDSKTDVSSTSFETRESKGEENSKQCDAQNCSSSLSDEGSSISSAFKGLDCATRRDKDATFEDSSGFYCGSNRSCGDSDSQVDDSMALVVFDTSQRSRRIDPDALDASVREVLDTLRRAKEELRSSMERRRTKMAGVGERNLSVKASTIFI